MGPARLLPGALAVLAAGTLVGSTAASLQHGGADPGAGAPDGAVRSASLEADLTVRGNGVRVRIAYRLTVPPDLEAVPLSGLSVRGTRISGLEARLGRGEPAPLSWDAGADSPAGRARVPIRGALDGDTATLELTYRVEPTESLAGEDGRIRLPVVQVAWPPEEARPGTFRARLELPQDAYVTETFPTVLGQAEATTEGVRRYELDLQVVPALVSVGLQEGEPPVLTFGRAVDVAVVGLLAVLGVWGFRALRRGPA